MTREAPRRAAFSHAPSIFAPGNAATGLWLLPYPAVDETLAHWKKVHAKPNLKAIHLANTGKVSDQRDAYFSIYDRVFAAHRGRPVALLEIGIQNGGSLELWARYFKSATILIGCDIDQRCAALQFDDERIDVVAADANSNAAHDVIRSLSAAYAIIIDDGSHHSRDMTRSLLRYFPLLRPGGIYVIEDLHASYWEK